MENVNPSNPEGKLTELIERSEYFSFEMNYNMNSVNERNFFYSYFASGNIKVLEILLFALTFLIIIIELAYLDNSIPKDYKGEITHNADYVIGIILILLSLAFTICWFYIRYPLLIIISIKEYLFNHPEI